LVEVWLPYGKTEVCVRIPTGNLVAVIEPREKEGALNPQAEIENALMNPIGTRRLADAAKPGDKVTVVLRDSGTSTNQIIVSAILKELAAASVKEEDITIIAAYDPLRTSPLPSEEPFLSEDLSSRVTVLRHDCGTSECVGVGRTSRGTHLYLSKKFQEADLKVLAGVVEPQPCAGYSGGREGVLPGVSSTETIQQSFSLSLNPKAERGSFEGNPVHEDMVEAARLAEVDFTLNIVRNHRLEVAKAFAGDLDEAFYESVKLAEDVYKVPVEGRADAVFISPGGYPFDIDLFEASKGIDGGIAAAKKGKVIVLVAECMNGCGNREFREALSRFRDPGVLERSLKKRFSMGGFMAYRLLTAIQRTKMVLVSVMPEYHVPEALEVKLARTANEAVDYAFDMVGKNGRVLAIPYGNLTTLSIGAPEQEQDGKEINLQEPSHRG